MHMRLENDLGSEVIGGRGCVLMSVWAAGNHVSDPIHYGCLGNRGI